MPHLRSAVPGLLIVLAVLLSLVGSDSAQAQINFEPQAIVTLDDTTPGANSDIEFAAGLSAQDLNFGQAITFIPPEWQVPVDEDVPDGALVGRASWQATFGLINASCHTPVTLDFEMMDATTSMDATVPVATSAGDEPGEADIGPGELPLGVTRYPDYLLTDIPGLTPITRLFGVFQLGGVDYSMNVLTFPPGTVIEMPGVSLVTDPTLGYPSVTVFGGLGVPELLGQPIPVTDWCTPLQASLTSLGVSLDNPATSSDESGVSLISNPEAGSYNFLSYASSQHDADGDGFENGLDTCALDANQGDPRVGGNSDFDNDGLDVVCDPNDKEVNSDQDADGYLNRGDNCPLVPNGEDQDNQTDMDGDRIGDACDANPSTPDGVVQVACVVNSVEIGNSGPTSSTPSENYLCTQNEVCVDVDNNDACDFLSPTATPTPVQLPETGGGPRDGGPLDTWHLVLAAVVGAIGGLVAGWYAWRRYPT
ncbi:MAG: hypothetical protein WD379_03030 [Dehalococcoidia bacterium]